MHPYIAQALITARVSDEHKKAAAWRRARQARFAARRAGDPGAAARASVQPAREANPATDRALSRPGRLLAVAQAPGQPDSAFGEAESPVPCGASR